MTCVKTSKTRQQAGVEVAIKRFLIWMALGLLLLAGCNGDDNGTNGNGSETIRISQEFFPIQDGSFWSYNWGNFIRRISGDTLVNGTTCKRLLENGVTAEAWTLTDSAFSQHLLAGDIWFDPPLSIPLEFEEGTPHQVGSNVYLRGDTSAIGYISGTVSCLGFNSLPNVQGNSYDSLLTLDYQIQQIEYLTDDTTTDSYLEYWARGIGLIFVTGTGYVLDFAVIDGDTLPRN
jgi:hypothetical protein